MCKFRFSDALQFFPQVALIAAASGLVIYSFGGEIKEYVDSVRVEKELDEINNDTTYNFPVFEEPIIKPSIDSLESESEEDLEFIEESETMEFESEIISNEIEEEIVDRYPISSSLLEAGYNFETINFDELLAINSDTDAWIKIDDTNVNLPVMRVDVQEKDADFYQYRDFYGNESKSGTLYMYRDNESLNNDEEDISDVSVIFGHHMRGNKVFSDICKYMSQSFYEKHPFGVVYTPDGYAYKLSFFAGIITPGGENAEIYMDKFTDEESFDCFVDNAIGKSTFKSDVEPSFGDKLMVLYTCEYTKGSNSRYALYGILEKQYTNELQISNNDEYTRRLK